MMARNRFSNLRRCGAPVLARRAVANPMCLVISRGRSHLYDESFRLAGFDFVGGYALQPRWADGHSTGFIAYLLAPIGRSSGVNVCNKAETIDASDTESRDRFALLCNVRGRDLHCVNCARGI